MTGQFDADFEQHCQIFAENCPMSSHSTAFIDNGYVSYITVIYFGVWFYINSICLLIEYYYTPEP